MTRFDDQITAVLEELARDQKDARNRKVVSDALLRAFQEGRNEGYRVKEERVLEVFNAMVKNA